MPRDTSNGRDPNWSEPETAMLICLANHYIAVLGSNSNDARTIKLKQQIWEDIETKMAQCNYKRCKERLRQKWQRLRAAMAKKERTMCENVAEMADEVESITTNVEVKQELNAMFNQEPQTLAALIEPLTSANVEKRKRGPIPKTSKPAKKRGRAKRVKLNEIPKNLETEFV